MEAGHNISGGLTFIAVLSTGVLPLPILAQAMLPLINITAIITANQK
jgi:hypothetical protein